VSAPSSAQVTTHAPLRIPTHTAPALAGLTLLLLACLLALQKYTLLTTFHTFFCMLVWVVIVALLRKGLRHHQHLNFGAANLLTSFRAMMSVLFLAFIPIAQYLADSTTWMAWITAAAAFALSLDGLDGWLARKYQLCSAFGARFDMEVDALLILILSVLVWQVGIAGVWILGLGLMRYAFVAASFSLPALRQPLFPSMRRKVVCVIQVAALCLMLCPWIQVPVATAVGIVALASLIYSFSVDSLWLLKTHKKAGCTL